MIRRLNYTGRRKIMQNSITYNISDINTSSVSFSCNVNLEEYVFPEFASVYIDIFKGSYLRKRFSLGTVGKTEPIESIKIPEFASFSTFNLMLLVIDMREEYKVILGKSSRLLSVSKELGDSKSSLLPIRPADLKQMWKLDFESGTPVLLLNRRIKNLRNQLVNDQLFRYSILPAAFREILTRIIIAEDESSESGILESEREKWLKYIETTLKGDEIVKSLEFDSDMETPPTIIERIEIIEKAVDLFSSLYFDSIMENETGGR